MNDQQHGHGHYPQNGYGDEGDSRDRREEYPPSQYQHPHHQHPQHQHPHHQQSQSQSQHMNGAQSAPASGSPPATASPFAFAPPPLSAQGQSSRPPMPLHHSEPAPQGAQGAYPQYYQKAPPPPAPTHTYPYSTTGGTSMSYRSYSGDSPRQSAAAAATGPGASPVQRSSGYPPAQNGNGGGSMQSPASASAYPPYQRHDGMYPPGGMSNSPHANSPQRSSMYAGADYYGPGPAAYQPQASDMPRSLSFPSNYPAAYPAYMSGGGGMMHPHLARHNTTSSMTDGLAGMDLSRPSLGYSFANRLPLVDRPFKCDECVQSFNRNHDLKRHKRIHLSVKPFGCDKCGKTFSRKDALRRHWLVKGCRGEDGATAPITPMYPINSQPPALSPSPPEVSPSEGGRQSLPPPLSYSHPSAPPPLASLPARAPSTQSQILVTPNEASINGSARSGAPNGIHAPIPRPLEEPLVIDPSIDPSLAPSSGAPGSHMSHGGSADGYFEGVVGIKQDGTALIDKAQQQAQGQHAGAHHLDSPYSRYPGSPSHSIHPHPYRRPNGVQSPVKAQHMAQDQKPVFAMPFAPGQGYDNGQAVAMEKQGSGSQEDDEPKGWQRWPSFPFPPAAGVNYHHQPQYDSNSPVEAQPQQAYA